VVGSWARSTEAAARLKGSRSVGGRKAATRLKGSRSVEGRKGVPTTAAANLRNSWRVMRKSLAVSQDLGSRVQRFSVLGSRFAVHGSRFTVRGSQFAVHSSRFTVHGS